MNKATMEDILTKELIELEEAGDIVLVNPVEGFVAKKLTQVLQVASPELLSASELSGILNALDAHKLGFGLDDNDFQTIIGLTKEQLKAAADKLKPFD